MKKKMDYLFQSALALGGIAAEDVFLEKVKGKQRGVVNPPCRGIWLSQKKRGGLFGQRKGNGSRSANRRLMFEGEQGVTWYGVGG